MSASSSSSEQHHKEEKLKFIEKCDDVENAIVEFIVKMKAFRKSFISQDFNKYLQDKSHHYLFLLITSLKNTCHQNSKQLINECEGLKIFEQETNTNAQEEELILRRIQAAISGLPDENDESTAEDKSSSDLSATFSQETVVFPQNTVVLDDNMILCEKVGKFINVNEIQSNSDDQNISSLPKEINPNISLLPNEIDEDITTSSNDESEDNDSPNNTGDNDFQTYLNLLEKSSDNYSMNDSDSTVENDNSNSEVIAIKRPSRPLSKSDSDETSIGDEIPNIPCNSLQDCSVNVEKLNEVPALEIKTEPLEKKNLNDLSSDEIDLDSLDKDFRLKRKSLFKTVSKKKKPKRDRSSKKNLSSSECEYLNTPESSDIESDQEDFINERIVISPNPSNCSVNLEEANDILNDYENGACIEDNAETRKKSSSKNNEKSSKSDDKKVVNIKSEEELNQTSSSEMFSQKRKIRPAWLNDSLLREHVSDNSDDDDNEKKEKAVRFKKKKSKIDKMEVDLTDNELNSSDHIVDIPSDSDSSIEFITESSNTHQPLKLESESFSENSQAQKGRRNIRAIISKATLDASTKRANVIERQRKERLQKRNANLEQFSQTVTTEEFVLDFDLKSKSPTIVVDPSVSKYLKPHQKEGIKFMWNVCYESVEKLKENDKGSGCILAHCMGLGKTLQVISLIHTLFSHPVTNTKHVLIVSPLSVVLNWEREFYKFLPNNTIKLFPISDQMEYSSRVNAVLNWHNNSGVLIIGYEAYHNIVLKGNDTTETSKNVKAALVSPGPDLVILDEGHLLKNSKMAKTKSLMQIQTKRRIVLTGTPLQNNLNEYYTMVNFVKPNLLGSKKEFTNRFENPIKNGQYYDSTEYDIKQMKKRIHVLHKVLDGSSIHRCGMEILADILPKKYDYALFLKLHPIQIAIYNKYMELIKSLDPDTHIGVSLFRDFEILQLICTHPRLLHCKKKALKNMKKNEKTNLNQERASFLDTEWWLSECPSDYLTNIEYSSKYQVMMSIIKESERVGDKLLIFTGSLIDLDSIEFFLHQKSSRDAKWINGKDYLRMDGSVKMEKRLTMCEEFNEETNTRLRLFLMTPRVGGLGLNLISANRVIIMNVSWNPSKDNQSIFRQYRLGQTKPCYVYRLVTMGAMEQNIYQRQITKSALAGRVVDKNHIMRHYNSRDIKCLYECHFDYPPTPLQQLPCDIVLAKTIQNSHDIFKFHEHQLLLENKPEEGLDGEELHQAWEEFTIESEEQDKLQKLKELRKSSSDVLTLSSSTMENFSNQMQQNDYSATSNEVPIALQDYLSKIISHQRMSNDSPTSSMRLLNLGLYKVLNKINSANPKLTGNSKPTTSSLNRTSIVNQIRNQTTNKSSDVVATNSNQNTINHIKDNLIFNMDRPAASMATKNDNHSQYQKVPLNLAQNYTVSLVNSNGQRQTEKSSNNTKSNVQILSNKSSECGVTKGNGINLNTQSTLSTTNNLSRLPHIPKKSSQVNPSSININGALQNLRIVPLDNKQKRFFANLNLQKVNTIRNPENVTPKSSTLGSINNVTISRLPNATKDSRKANWNSVNHDDGDVILVSDNSLERHRSLSLSRRPNNEIVEIEDDTNDSNLLLTSIQKSNTLILSALKK